jgi:hypothetical protein
VINASEHVASVAAVLISTNTTTSTVVLISTDTTGNVYILHHARITLLCTLCPQSKIQHLLVGGAIPAHRQRDPDGSSFLQRELEDSAQLQDPGLLAEHLHTRIKGSGGPARSNAALPVYEKRCEQQAGEAFFSPGDTLAMRLNGTQCVIKVQFM